MSVGEVRVAVASAALLGESPFWHPRERALYYCDIPGKRLYRFDPAGGALTHWEFDTEPGSCAPCLEMHPLLANCLRLTGGNAEDNAQMLAALQASL